MSRRIADETKQRQQEAMKAREENEQLKQQQKQQQQQRLATQPNVSTVPLSVPTGFPFQAYPTNKPRERCSTCGGWFVPNMNGSKRRHTCIPLSSSGSALALYDLPVGTAYPSSAPVGGVLLITRSFLVRDANTHYTTHTPPQQFARLSAALFENARRHKRSYTALRLSSRSSPHRRTIDNA
eukprot:4135017-Prymnesium_polylepis.1